MHDVALILNVGKFREYDAWVRLLTRQSGICTAFAFGASKSRRRFAGCLDVFNIVHVTIEKSRKNSFLQLQETSLIESFEFRNDWKLVGIGMNCLRFVEALNIAPETSELSYDFVLDFLKRLPQFSQQAALMPPLFRFKLGCIQGYAPNITSCVRCKCGIYNTPSVFSVQEGGILCPDCKHKSLSTAMHIDISGETLNYLQDVQNYSPHVWLDEEIPIFIAQQYGKVIDAFTQYHLGLEWHKNRFVQL